MQNISIILSWTSDKAYTLLYGCDFHQSRVLFFLWPERSMPSVRSSWGKSSREHRRRSSRARKNIKAKESWLVLWEHIPANLDYKIRWTSNPNWSFLPWRREALMEHGPRTWRPDNLRGKQFVQFVWGIIVSLRRESRKCVQGLEWTEAERPRRLSRSKRNRRSGLSNAPFLRFWIGSTALRRLTCRQPRAITVGLPNQ